MTRRNNLLVVIVAICAVVVFVFATPNPAGTYLRSIVYPQKPITKEEAWAVFEAYMNFARANDIDGLRSVSYKLGAACSDPARREECNGVMTAVAALASSYKQEDFTNAWGDSRQIILSSDWQLRGELGNRDIYREIMYIVRAQDGKLKLLYVALPYDAVTVNSTNRPLSDVDNLLVETVKDTDKDGLDDLLESCSDTSVVCNKTNPGMRDTDGDGWWDSVEMYLPR